MIEQLLNLLGKKFWILLGGVLLCSTILFITAFYYPITVKVSRCVQREDSYTFSNTSYVVRNVIEEKGGASIRFCITEVTKTVRNNLVDK